MLRSMFATQFTVSLKEPGALETVTELLSRRGIEIAGAMVDENGGPPKLRFVAGKPEGLEEALRSAGCGVEASKVCCVDLLGGMGEFERLTRALLDHGVGIRELYGARQRGDRMTLVLGVSDPAMAAAVLRGCGDEFAPLFEPGWLMAADS